MLRIKWIVLLLFPFGFATAQINDAVLSKRLEEVQSQVPLSYNSYVRQHINDYLRNDQQNTSTVLARFLRHESTVEQIIRSYELPKELKYMALSLSGCDPFQQSEEGGTGVYLMRYSIAKNKGLHISSYVDERRDLIKSTHAFCQEVKELYKKYDDWHKTIAAYYSTSLEMDRAISYSKDSLERYWSAHTYLPFSYRKTVSKFIAAVYIAHYYPNHNIKLLIVEPVITDTVPIRQTTTIGQLATKLEIEYDLLKELNPIYRKQVIPNSGRDYYLILPKEKVEYFYALGDSVYMGTEVVQDTVQQEEVVQEAPPPQPTYTTIYYTVRRGDILSYIADYYDTRVSSIKRWNGLRSDRINVNQRLKIVVPTSKLEYYNKINGMTAAQKRRIANRD